MINPSDGSVTVSIFRKWIKIDGKWVSLRIVDGVVYLDGLEVEQKENGE
jgi:hypothetical protein